MLHELESLTATLNKSCGYTTRYRLHALPGKRAYALMKAVGNLDENVSTYLTFTQMKYFLLGHLVGYNTALRRSPS